MFDIAYQARAQFIRDRAGERRSKRNKKKALRRFGMIVRQQGRKNIKRGKIKRLKAITTTGRQVEGHIALAMIKNGSAKAENVISFSPEPNLRTIFYGMTSDDNVLIGPVGFGHQNPTVPEQIEDQHPFMGPALESRYHELTKSLEKFGVI